MTLTLYRNKGAQLTTAEADANMDHLGLSSNHTFTQSGSGAIARTMQDKAREIEASIFDFMTSAQRSAWTARTTTSSVATEIQAAIDAVNTAGGGRVKFPVGSGSIGTTGLTTYQTVRLVGDAQAFASNNDRAVELIYSGTGSAIIGTNLRTTDIENIAIDCTNATGASVRGIYLKGAWLSTLRNVRVKGVTPAKGYSILIDTNAGAWGAQHNYLERVEASDGVIRLAGVSGADAVTTTVLNTIRGAAYEFQHASAVAINATAEKNGTMTVGYTLSGTGQTVLIGCDIEGAYTTGIAQSDTHEVWHTGTDWAGFTGTNRVTGAFAVNETFGGNMLLSKPGVANGGEFPALQHGAMAGVSVQDFVEHAAIANEVTGGSQDGHYRRYRRIAGTRVLEHEARRNFRVEHAVSVANVATTVLTIPIATNTGIRVRAHAQGIQTGAGSFSARRDAVVVNDLGSGMVITAEAAVTAVGGGAAPVFTFTASGANLLVQFNHASASATTINFVIEIDGPVTGYTKA